MYSSVTAVTVLFTANNEMTTSATDTGTLNN